MYTRLKPPNERGFTLVEIMIVVVIIGLLITMAIPGIQRVRIASQDKAVLNNARQLASAADQYFMENGVTTVPITSLVGPGNYVRTMAPVANETYPTTFNIGEAIVITGIGGVRTLTFSY